MARPAFKPTKEQCRLVQSLAAIGMRHEDIAVVVGVRSPKTLRKHFRTELSVGSAEAIAAVSSTAYEMARSGKWPRMTEYWISIMGAVRQPDHEHEADEPKPRVRGNTCELMFRLPGSSALVPREEVPLASEEV